MTVVTAIITALAGPFGWLIMVGIIAAAALLIALPGAVARRLKPRRPQVIDDMLPVVFLYRGTHVTADQVLDQLEQAREHDDDTFQWDGLTSELNKMLGRDRRG